MPSHFSSIGFSVASDDECRALCLRLVRQGLVLDVAEGHYVVAPPDHPAQVWLQTVQGKTIVGANPHYSGHAKTITIPRDARRHNFDPASAVWVSWAIQIAVASPGRSPRRQTFPFRVE